LGLFFYFTQGFWENLALEAAYDSFLIEADKYGPRLPPVDQVDVLLLSGIQKSKEQSGFMETRIADYNIAGKKTLVEKQAEEVAQIWRFVPQNSRYSALCHEPLYALRFWKDGKVLCELTICWHCSNFGLTVPGDLPMGDRELGFDSRSPAAIALLNKLKEIVPPQASSQ